MPVVGTVWCTTNVELARESVGDGLPNTLLGFETTGPQSCPVGGRGCVVASLWWWGVVFDLWIVVASI